MSSIDLMRKVETIKIEKAGIIMQEEKENT
jgi:hypothetical protein